MKQWFSFSSKNRDQQENQEFILPQIEEENNSDRIIPHWKESIHESSAILREFMDKSERGFLAAGKNLFDINNRTQKIFDTLSVLMEQFSGSQNNSSIDTFHTVTEKSTGHLHDLDSKLIDAVSHLALLKRPIDVLPEYIEQFDRIVKRMRVMGIATRIETARIHMSDLGFEHLAEIVTSLADEISEKGEAVRQHLRTIRTVTRSNDTKLNDLQTEYQKMLDHVMRDLTSSFHEIDERHEVYGNSIAGIKTKSENAVRNVHSIVQAIQFHDITRQQIEHVLEALNDNLGSETEQEEELLANVAAICTIQSAQLVQAKNDFDQAVYNIITSLGALESDMKMIVLESEHIAGFSFTNGSNFFSKIESRFVDIITSITEGGHTLEEMMISLSNINVMIRKMKLFMDEIADVGSEIELLSLNSRIRAAKAGDQGAALGVISESIQLLSYETREHITAMNVHAEQMVDVAEKFKHDIDDADPKSETNRALEEMIQQIRSAIAEFHETNTNNSKTFEENEKVCALISSQIDSVVSEISKNLEYSTLFTTSADILTSLTNQIYGTFSTTSVSIFDKRVDELKQRYTMHSERVVHAQVTNDRSFHAMASEESESAGGTVELF